MNETDTPITRRQAVVGIVAVGSSFAGCSSVSSETENDTTSSTNSTVDIDSQLETTDPLDVAETNLEAGFEMLNEITVIEGNEISYVDTGQDPDWSDIADKSDNVETALEAAHDEYDHDAKRFVKLELGATLLEYKFVAYNAIESIDSSTDTYIEHLRFELPLSSVNTIERMFQNVEDITNSAHESFDAIEELAANNIDVPDYYDIDRIDAESAVFADFADIMTLWFNGLQEWPRALAWGSKAANVGDDEEAIKAYNWAISYCTAAQESFDERDGRPPVFREPVDHATCRLSTLLETYQTAKLALEHRRDGDEETARDLLEEAHTLAEYYTEECHPSNPTLVPPLTS